MTHALAGFDRRQRTRIPGSALGLLMKIALLAAIVGYAVSQIELQQMRQTVTAEILVGIIVIQIPLFLATSLNAFRHSILVRSPRAPFSTCLAAVLLSAGLNLVTPGRISEAIKATYVRRVLGLSLANGTAAIVVERLFDLAVVSTIAVLGITGTLLDDNRLVGAALVLAVTGLICIRPLSTIGLRLLVGWEGRLIGFLRSNCEHVVRILDGRKLLAVAGLTIASWVIHYFAVWLFFFLQPQYVLTFTQSAVVFGAILFAGAVPALPGGLGMVQAAVVLALTSMSFTFEAALALAVAIHIAEILISAVSAPILLLSRSTGVRKLLQDLRTSQAEA